MTKKPIDYSKALFYRLVCRDVSITECYVGSTTNETQRRANHKSKCTNETDPSHNYFVYRFIREHGSWTNWELIVIEHRPVNNKIECRIRERFFVEQYKAKLNKNIPSRTPAEYYVDHYEKLNQKQAAYDLANSERLKTKHACECGGRFTTAGKCQHMKSNRHVAFAAVPK
jgi:hypothetical protein